MRGWRLLLLLTTFCAGCSASTANVDKERETLMTLDREWAGSTKDMDKFMSYYAPDASAYPAGMPVARGTGAIRDALSKMFSAPGFSLTWAPIKSDVSASGDIGYTSGTYQATMNGGMEKGKYVEIWKKQPGGEWKVKEDIFNADEAPAAGATTHVMVEAGKLTWGDAPPSLPPGAKLAVVAGDPSKAGPFVVRLQVPAGYKIAPHWHPGDENVTVLTGTAALGMGDSFDESRMQTLGVGGYAALPAQMHHYFQAKSAATVQVHGTGPFVVNYINPADDPSKK